MADSLPRSAAQHQEHRQAARFDTAIEVDVGGLSARARNISASGVYFETDVDLPVGAVLNLNVQFTHNGRKQWLACEGTVVRATRTHGQHGIAARLLTPFFAPEEERVVATIATR
ncbi:MAG: PilZ domain-containing protein [Ramlibacter sp.]|nr:PilZ domain-containing protein [Ramlibacter sp.]